MINRHIYKQASSTSTSTSHNNKFACARNFKSTTTRGQKTHSLYYITSGDFINRLSNYISPPFGQSSSMDKLTSIGKGGWHPEKTGSIRGDIVCISLLPARKVNIYLQKSWVGRGDSEAAQARERAQAHNSTPLSALKDPSSFAPPPKHTGFYPSNDGGATEVSQSPIILASGVSRPLPARPKATTTIGEPETTEEESSRSGPFVVDTTGLSTAHLPKPPVKRVGTLPSTISAQTPARQSNVPLVPSNSNLASAAKTKKPGPPLPPRLPPRSAVAENGPTIPLSPPPSYSSATTSPTTATSKASEPQQVTGLLNQDAIGRLGAAGITVPGFGITPNRNAPEAYHIDKDNTNSTIETSGLQSRVAALGFEAVGARNGNPNGLAMLAGKKKPAPPPTKPTSHNTVASAQTSTQDDQPQPPPVPLNTKPR